MATNNAHVNATGTGAPARKSKRAWAVNGGSVREVTIYECLPNDNIWWCPELGYSCSGPPHEFFATEREAVRKALDEVTVELVEVQSLLAKLKKRWVQL